MPNPFEPTEIEAIAITNIGLMIGHLIIIIFLICLMIYSYRKIKDILPVVVIYMFSLIIGVICIGSEFMIFTPYISLFFILFQTIMFYLASSDYYLSRKNKDD